MTICARGVIGPRDAPRKSPYRLPDSSIWRIQAADRRGPTGETEWYGESMSGTYPVVMGDRGRLVIPAELRERLHLEAGSPLLLLDTPGGMVLATREQVKKLVRDRLRGLDLVDELLADRRREASADDHP